MIANTIPHLLLHFDVNGTLVLKDSSRNVTDDYMLISALAESTFAKWNGSEQMSYKEYVYNRLLPGKKSDKSLKVERQKVVGNFLSWLTETSHPTKQQVCDDYVKIKNKYTDPKSNVFPSFYRLLEKIRQMQIPFTILLRTFGSDLSEITQEIEGQPSGIQFRQWATFKDSKLRFSSGKTIEKTDQIFESFLNSKDHFAIQDDWKKWNSDDELGRSGKPFIYDVTGKQIKRNLSLFFDDNITGKEEDIGCPMEMNGNNVPTSALVEKLIFPVNTKEAMLNDNYYIDLVMGALKRASVN